MISDMDPFIRLELLKLYMVKWIDRYPTVTGYPINIETFAEFIRNRHPDKIPGRPEYYKRIATHCFYCDEEFPEIHLDGDPRRRTQDHYYPKSKGGTEKYVICCNLCNTKKGNMEPTELVKQITRSILRGRNMWGFHTKKLERIAAQINVITNDLLYNTGPRVYYTCRKPKSKRKKR